MKKRENTKVTYQYSLEGLMLKLKLQYFGHLMWRADSLEKTLMLGKTEGRRGRGQQRMRWLDGITDSMDMGWVDPGSWWWTGRPGVLWFMGSQRVGYDWVTELNWTEFLIVLLGLMITNNHILLLSNSIRSHVSVSFEFQGTLIYYIYHSNGTEWNQNSVGGKFHKRLRW